MKNYFVTTSWSGRVGTTLPLVIKNKLDQSVIPDSILVYLSLEEFPNRENDLPSNLLEIADKSGKVEFRWSEGNIKSYKRLLSIKDNPDSNLVIYDDDTLHGNDWFEQCLKQLDSNTNIVHGGWFALRVESNDLSYIKNYLPTDLTPSHYFLTNGFCLNSNLYKNVEFDLYKASSLGNDDDYYFHMINVINGIKTIGWTYHGVRKLLTLESDMRNSKYRHRKILKYWESNFPDKFKKYMETQQELVKDKIFLYKDRLY